MAEAWQSENVILGMVIRKSGMLMVFDTLGGDRQVAVITFMLITSKLRLTSPSDMPSAGVLCGRWYNTAFMGFLDLG
jgi:hypothetical protein